MCVRAALHSTPILRKRKPLFLGLQSPFLTQTMSNVFQFFVSPFILFLFVCLFVCLFFLIHSLNLHAHSNYSCKTRTGRIDKGLVIFYSSGESLLLTPKLSKQGTGE